MSDASSRTLLVIAGLDPSGGAGLLADARVAWEHGLRVAGVATVLTEQDSRGLRRAAPVSADLVGAQLRAIAADVDIAAIKIGALGDEGVLRAVSAALEHTGAPLVWDPVMRASAGNPPLYAGHPRDALAALAPRVSLITPNLGEAEALADTADASRRPPDRDWGAAAGAARALAAQVAAALVKGGHRGGTRSPDVLARGDQIVTFDAPRVPGGEDVHGTGCALSTAIASQLARGTALEAAVRAAKDFVAARLTSPHRGGRGAASIA